MGMARIVTAKSDHFAIASNGLVLVMVAVMTQVPLHEPRLCMVRIYGEDSVEKNLRYVPTFLRNGPRCVPTIDANHPTVVLCFVVHRQHNGAEDLHMVLHHSCTDSVSLSRESCTLIGHCYRKQHDCVGEAFDLHFP